MIKYLEIQGEDRPIRISYIGLKKLKAKLGRSISPTDDGTDYEAYEALLFFSLEKGHEIEKKEMPFKWEEREALMDEVFMDFLELVPEFFETTKERDARLLLSKEMEKAEKKKKA